MLLIGKEQFDQSYIAVKLISDMRLTAPAYRVAAPTVIQASNPAQSASSCVVSIRAVDTAQGGGVEVALSFYL